MTSKVRNGAIKEDGESADSAARVRFFFASSVRFVLLFLGVLENLWMSVMCLLPDLTSCIFYRVL